MREILKVRADNDENEARKRFSSKYEKDDIIDMLECMIDEYASEVLYRTTDSIEAAKEISFKLNISKEDYKDIINADKLL